jgi:flagellin-like hook-associated protein FlgL
VANNPAGVGAVLHGPVVSSNAATSLTTGDTISFDWRAQGGTDAFDVYAYIVDTQTGRTEELLNATGASAADTRPWTTVSHTVAAAGEYRFVFLSGSWDATGGQVAGAKLFIDNVTVATSSGRRSDSGLSDINSASSASIALGTIDTALNAVNSARSTMGSYIDRLLHIADNLGNVSSNAVQSRSTIIDTDYALETTALAKNQIIQQAATAMLAQANQHPQAVMALLKNLRA